MTEKSYANADITVVWKPALCIHSETCFKGLGAVFDPTRRPWIDINAATSEVIVRQVEACPSGALSWRRNAAADVPAPDAVVTIEPLPNGPLVVRGAHALRGTAGDDAKSGAVAYCRCGASKKKPYCDGSHVKIGFKS